MNAVYRLLAGSLGRFENGVQVIYHKGDEVALSQKEAFFYAGRVERVRVESPTPLPVQDTLAAIHSDTPTLKGIDIATGEQVEVEAEVLDVIYKEPVETPDWSGILSMTVADLRGIVDGFELDDLVSLLAAEKAGANRASVIKLIKHSLKEVPA